MLRVVCSAIFRQSEHNLSPSLMNFLVINLISSLVSSVMLSLSLVLSEYNSLSILDLD